MEGIRVKGRGFPAPVIEVVVTREGIRIRVDDEMNPEAWLEITFTAEVLEALDHQCYEETIKGKDGAP